MRIARFTFWMLLCASVPAFAQENRVAPYVDPAQLHCPGVQHSFYLEPWRAFLETRPADTLVHGIGINYNAPPEADDLAVRLLAESGFKSFRIEVGWDAVAWDETHLNNERRLRHLLDLCRLYGIRPNLLLNANHIAPGLFDGATPLEATQSLNVEVTELGEPRRIFEGDANHPPLWQRDAFAVLPFQVNDRKFVIAIYAMTYDATKPFPEQRYRLTLGGFATAPEPIGFYDPFRDTPINVHILGKSSGELELELPVTDTPRLLTIVTATRGL